MSLRLFVLIATLVIGSSNAQATVYTYDFGSCNPGVDCWAYEDDVDQFTFGNNIWNRNTHNIAAVGDYTNLGTSDNGRWATIDPGNWDEILLWLEMTIGQNVANISQIDFTFEGYLNGSNANFTTYALQDGQAWENDASWDAIGAAQFIGTGADTSYTRSLTSNFATYINAGTGLITWGVYEDISSQMMMIDYVKIDVHVPDATSFTDDTEVALDNLGARTTDTITITGTDFGTAGCSAPDTVVKIGTYTVDCADVTVWNDTTITFTLNPLIANEYGGVGSLVVQVNGGVDPTPLDFRVYPRITSLNPNAGNIGAPVQVIGDHLCQSGVCPGAGSRGNAANNVTFNSGVMVPDGSVSAWTHTQIDVVVPAGAITGNVVVTSNTSYLSNGVLFTVDSTAPVLTALNTGPANGDCIGPTNITFVFDVTEQILADNDLTLNWEFYSGAPTGIADGTAGMTVGGVTPNYTVTGLVPGGSALAGDTDINVWVTGTDTAGNGITSTSSPTYLAANKGAYKIAKEIVITNAMSLAAVGGNAGEAIAVNIESRDGSGAVCAADNQTFLTCTSNQGTGSFWEDAAMTTQIIGGAQVAFVNGLTTIYYMDTDSTDPDPQITIADTDGKVDNSPDAVNKTVNIKAVPQTVYDFSTCAPGTNCWAYENDSDQFTYGGDPFNRNTHTEASALEYTQISASDNVRWTTTDPGNWDEMFLWMEMTVAESISTIEQIDFTFEGYLNNQNTNFTIYVLQDGQPWEADASWDAVNTSQAINTGADSTMTRSLTSNFASYINPGTGLITWGVYSNGSSDSMLIDYVRMVVKYNNPPVLNIDSASQTSTDGGGEVTLQYDLTDADLDGCSLLIEYSYDNTNWYQAYIKSASVGTVSNTGVDTGSSAGQITAIPTNQANATFIWDTQNALNQNGAFTGADTSVWLRVTPTGTKPGTLQTSGSFTVDNQVPVQANWSPLTGSTICAANQSVTLDTDENAWCRWSLSDDAYTAMTNGCTGDGGTSPHTCNLTGLGSPSDIAYLSCRDSYGNQSLSTTNTELTYFIDVTGSPTQSNWSPIDGATITTASPNITLTLSEKGDCKWSLTDQAYSAMAGDCTGDGTININCSVSGMSEGTDDVFIACADMCGNEDTAGTNSQLTYLVDTQPPAVTVVNPADGSFICANNGTIVLTTNETAWCRWSLDDFNYDSMADDCTGGGTTSLSCDVTGLINGNDIVYFACKDIENNKNSSSNNAELNYIIDTVAPTAIACDTPLDGALDQVLSPTLTATVGADQGTISYYFEVAKDAGFTTAVQQSGWQSADNDWVPGTTLNSDTLYYWHVKARDACGFETGSYSTAYSFRTLQVTPDMTFKSVIQTSTNGTGLVTVTYDVTDIQNDNADFLVEYSTDSVTWYQAYLTSASVGTIDNTGVDSGTATSTIKVIPTPQTDATFVWDTQNVNNQGGSLDGIEDDTVFIRITTFDAAQGETEVSAAFAVDNKSPANYDCSSPSNGTTGVSRDPTLTAASGTDLSTISYYIEIAKDSAFTIAVNQSGWQPGVSWNPPTLDQGIKYYWHVKTRDQYGNEGSYSVPPWSFTVTVSQPDVNVDNAVQTSTDATGLVTVQYDITDPDNDICTLLVEYSYDDTNWYQANIFDASTGAVDNTGVNSGTSTGQITGLSTPQSNITFRWNTQSAGNEGGSFMGEDITVYVRITPNDGSQDGQKRNSAFFSVDNQAPTGAALQYPTNLETNIDTNVTLTAEVPTDISTVYYWFQVDLAAADWAAPGFQESAWESVNTWSVGTTLAYVTNYEYRVRVKDQYGNEAAYTAPWQFTTGPAPDTAAWPFTLDSNYSYDTSKVLVSAGMAQLRASASPGWIAPTWQYRKKITIDNTGSSNDLTDYHMLVELDGVPPDNYIDFTHAAADGSDIRFANSDGTSMLNFWIQSYDSGAQTAKIWVKIPTVPAFSEHEIFLYYGYSGVIATTSNIATTFGTASWSDGAPSWTQIETANNVTTNADVLLGTELIMDGDIQTLSGDQRYSKIELKNNSTLYVQDNQVLRLYASNITVDSTSKISASSRGYNGGTGGVMCLADAAAPWNGGRAQANDGGYDAVNCAAANCFGGGGWSHENATAGSDGRGGGGGGYGGAGGRGEDGWSSANQAGLFPPSCPGNYSYSGGNCVIDTYGRAFGSNSNETLSMGSGGGAGSASCYAVPPPAFSSLALGGDGGDGGGAVLLDAGNITVAGNILANGGIGGSGLYDAAESAGGAGGGGGAGGTILLRGQNVNLSGTMEAKGGLGGSFTVYGAAGGGGGGGRIKVFASALTDTSTKTVTGGAVGGNNGYTPDGSGGANGTTWIDSAYTYTYNSGIADSGNITSYEISPVFFGKTFTANHTIPSVGTLSYEIRRASDNALLCSITAAQAASGYDISPTSGNCPAWTAEDTTIRVYASLSTTNFPGTPIIADASLDYYIRNTVGTAPSYGVGAEQTFVYYTDNPTIKPISSFGYVFAELVSFTETLGAGNQGQARYQISNDGTSWYYHNGTSWISASTYSQTNTAAEINANCSTFDNEIGGGTLYFRAYLNSDGTQAVQIDSIDITLIAPPTPDITALTPDHGVTGTTVTITGTDFGTSQGQSTIMFNGVDAGFASSWSNTSITIDAPADVLTGYVIVTVRGVQSPKEADSIFTVDQPVITSLTPDTGYWMDPIIITGTNFGDVQGNSYVTFSSNVRATCSAWSNTSITCSVPPGTVTGAVTITTAGGGDSAVNPPATTFTMTADNSIWPFEIPARYSWDPDMNVGGGLAYLSSNNTPNWYDQNWQYRRSITIDNTGGGVLTDFQVQVELNNTNFSFANAQTDGDDIRFTDNDGTTLLNHWIQSYDAGGLQATVWVKIPSIPANSTKNIYIYYGNATAGSGSDALATLDASTWTDGNPAWTQVETTTSIDVSGADAQLEMQTNNAQITCTDTWGSPCDAQTDSDNTWDACNNQSATTQYTKTLEATLNKTKAALGDTVQATCRFQGSSSDNGTEWYIYYYNGVTWAQIPGASGNLDADQVFTQTFSFTVTGNPGDQWVRCISDQGGDNDSCADNAGAPDYWDNDDVRFYVHYKTSGEMRSTSIDSYMQGNLFTANHTIPGSSNISYKILKASDNTTLCTITAAQAAAGYDISGCAPNTEPIKVWAELTVSASPPTVTPSIQDYTISYYGRQTATPQPGATVGPEVQPTYYTTDPTVRNVAGQGLDFLEIISFTEIIGPRNQGSVKYQISNDGTNWYWWNGSNWVAETGGGYTQANDSTEVNDNIIQFDNDVGSGTFYFRAYMHSNGSQSVEIDGISINVAQITITEVHNDGTQVAEGDDYVQLYNPFSATYDLGGHVIGDGSGAGDGEYTIPAGQTVASKGYYLLTKNQTEFNNRFSCDPLKVHQWSNIDLDSAGDEVYLKQNAAAGQSMDLVVWGAYNAADLPEGTFSGTVAPLSGDGNSIKRIADGYEGNERDSGDADASPENDELCASTFLVVSPPTPYCAPPTTGSIVISDNGGYTNDSTPAMSISCEDPAGVPCNSSDFMRLACTEAGLSGATWMSYEKKCNETGYSCTFNILSGTGCTAGEGSKTVWVEFRNDKGNIQTTHTSDTTNYDITPPVITAVAVYSDKDQYLCGTADGCVSLSATTGGTSYFNNLGGEGNAQKMTVELTWNDSGGAGGAQDFFIGQYAFAETPTYDGVTVGADFNGADGWKQTYVLNSGEGDETGVTMTVYDKAGNSKTVDLNFVKDNVDPSITYNWPLAGGVTNWYKTNPGPVINVDFGWGGGSPLAYAQYRIAAGAWNNIFNAFQYSSYLSNWPITWTLVNEGLNSVSVKIVDGCGNATTHTYVDSTTGFLFRKDTTPPTITSFTTASNNEPYFYGNAADALDCTNVSAYPSITCTAWFNSLAGQGGGQILTNTITWSDTASYDRLQGEPAFGDSPAADPSGPPWTVIYSVENGTTNQLDVDFNVYDQAGNKATVKVDYRVDNTPPTFVYNSPSAGGATPWYSSDPGNIEDIDLAWSYGAPLVLYEYQIGAGAWTTIWTGQQSATYTVNWGIPWASLSEGENQINLRGRDAVGNIRTDSYVSGVTGILFRKDLSPPDNPATPVNAWDSSAKGVVLTTGNTYTYNYPYFEWAAPSDNPLPASSGVSGYYVGFSTDSNFDPTDFQTAASFIGTSTVCGQDLFLRIKTVDSATPTANATGAVTAFVYRNGGAAGLTDNQTGDDVWRATTGTTYDVDFSGACGANIDTIQYAFWSAANMGSGTGTELLPWTTFVSSPGVPSYTTDWTIDADWGSAADGINWVSVKICDVNAVCAVATDAFYILKDTLPPDNSPVTGYDTSGKVVTLTDATWYNYPAPYFEWAAVSDHPVTLNSGFAAYDLYFGTDPAGTPDISVTATGYTSTATLVSGSVYYLRMSSRDNVGNATAATTLFTYKYDSTSPDNPTVTGYATDGMLLPALISGDWYTYAFPYFVWSGASDLPAGVDGTDNSGILDYLLYFGNDPAGTPDIATAATVLQSTATLVCSNDYYLRMLTRDNAGNATGASTVFTYRYDGDPPAWDYNAPATGSVTAWYGADPGAIADIDLIWGGCSPLTEIAYSTGTGFWRTAWSGSQSANVTADWALTWSDLVDGLNPISIVGIDTAGNHSTETYATGTAGFLFRKDTQAPNNPTVTAYATDGMLPPALTDGNWYTYAYPYFTWSGAADMPAGVDGTDNSGIQDYLVYFGDDSAGVPDIATTATVLQSTATLVCSNDYYLRLLTRDNVGNATSAQTLYTYRYDGSPPSWDYNSPATGSMTAWYNADPGAIFDIDLLWGGCSPLTEILFSTGTGVWTTVWSGSQTSNVTADWSLDWASLADGLNQISIVGVDAAGNRSTETYAANSAGFLFRKDTVPPDNPAVSAFDSSGKTVPLTDSTWYSYPNPYFEWAAATDLPAGVDGTDNSGLNLFNIYFGTDPAGLPTTATTTATNYTATGALVSGETYYLRISSEDNAGNATTTTTMFTYRFDNTPPTLTYNDPTGGGMTPWYSSDPGAVMDIDLIWGNQAPLTLYRYWDGTAWNTIFSGASSSDYTTDWSVDWASMVEGRNEIRLSGYDQAGNQVLHSYTTGVTGFVFRKDITAPDAVAGPANAWDTDSKVTVLADNGSYDYANPYFEWSAPADNPAGVDGTDNSDLSYYYIAFSTDTANPVFATIPAAQNYFYATPSTCGATYTLMIKAVDSATPSANVSATTTLFTYVYGGNPSITDNQLDDPTWYNADPGAIWDVDFNSSACSSIDYAQYTIYTAANGGGTLKKDWTYLLGPGYGLTGSSADWGLDFAAAADGINYVSVRLRDSGGNLVYATDAFTFRKDTIAPDNTVTAGYDSSGKSVALTDGEWYNYPNPYFEWSPPADLPAGVAGTDNSGIKLTNIYFGTDPLGVPTTATTTATNYTATGVLVSGQTYYLRLSNEDNAGNATTTSTAFTYRFDNTAPGITYNDPTGGGATPWYSSDPGAVMDIDLIWGSQSPLTLYRYWNGVAWTTIFSGTSSADYTTDWSVNWAAMNEGRNEIRLSGYDRAGNQVLHSFATGTTGFLFRKDITAPDAPAGPAGAWDTNAKATALTSGVQYDYPNPYFEWSPPADYPAGTDGLDNSGLSFYYIAFSTDTSNPVFATIPATQNYFHATPTVCGATYTLMIRAADAAVPAANVSATASMFTYVYGGNTSISDNQSGDNTWYSSNPGAVFDVDFQSSCDPIDYMQYTLWSGPNMTGSEILTWQNIAGPGYGGTSYTANWGIDFTNAAEGVNYITVRAVSTGGQVATGTDVFYFRKDTQAPDKTAEPVSGYASDSKITALVNNNTYDYPNPYFEWAEPADNPAGVNGTDNSGIGAYLVGFGTDPANITFTSQAANSYYASPTACDATYTLLIKTMDNAQPTANVSSTATAFTFKFAGATTITDNQSDFMSWYSSDPSLTADVDFISSCASIDYTQYTIWSGPNMTGTELMTWTDIVGPGYGGFTYTTNWPVDFSSSVDGVNYVSVKMVTSTSNTVTATDVFTFRRDQLAPDNAAAVNGYATDGKFISLVSGGGYDYTNPYFEWSAPDDNPAGVNGVDNAGLAYTYVSFSTDPANPVWTAIPAPQNYFYATPTACGATYTLVMKTADSATPTANVSATATFFDYYFTGTSSIADNQAGDDTWHNTDPGAVYNVDFNSPCSLLDTIQYVVYSGPNQTGTKIIDWTDIAGPAYGGNTYTANWGIDFANADEGINYVSVRMVDVFSNTTAIDDVFYVKKDTLAPTISTPAYSESSSYLWESPSDGKVYYGTGMGAAEAFSVTGTATDTSSGWAVSGLDRAAFSAAFDDAPADDASPATWSGAYDIEASNTGGATILVTVYDVAGNFATAQFVAINNNALTITYATLSKEWRPSYSVFNIYYPDGVTELTASSPTGLAETWLSIFNQASADVSASFSVSRMEYDGGACQAASGAGAWCMEFVADQCRPAADDPHHIGLGGNSTADGFRTTLAQELSTGGDLADGTFTATPGPDYLVVIPEEDGIIYTDIPVTQWCAGAACSPACTAAYCSNTTNTITARPDFVKFNDGGTNMVITDIGDNAAAANLEWSWDTVNNRIMLFNDPSSATVTYTPANSGEKVCVYLKDACDQTIVSGKWENVEVLLTLSQAPNSGMDIVQNLADATTGFSTMSIPASGDLTVPGQTQIKGTLKQGKACVTLTAESVPNDSPSSPIRVDATYFDPDTGATATLSQSGGSDAPAMVEISGTPGVASGSATWVGVASQSVIFQPSPDDSSLTVTMDPVWSLDGNRIAVVSRQSNPCDGAAATGTTPFDNFNIYIRKYSGTLGDWNECLRLTRNTTDGADFYGPLAASDITFDPAGDKVVFAGTDIGGTGMDKLFWVSATAPLATPSVGTQADVAVSDPFTSMSNLTVDANPGDTTVDVGFVDPILAVGQQVVVGDLNFTTFEYNNMELKTITALGASTITFDSPLSSGYSVFTASTMGTVQYPVTFSVLGQNISPMTDDSSWIDPAWSPNEAQHANCADPPDPAAGRFGDSLAVVRWSPSGSADYTGTAPGYANGGNANPNIIMFYGTKAGTAPSEFYKFGVSNIAKITNFSGNTVQPLKPKWSPDCSKLAFVAWDRSVSDTPAQTSIYVVNLNDTRAGWATASLPVSSLTATGVYRVYDYASRNMPAFFPNWSAGGKLVSYAVDTTNSLDLLQLGAANDQFANQIFGSIDFDSYLEYIEDQPPALGGLETPQIIGRANENEFGLAQCPGMLTGSSCPANPAGSDNFSFGFVSQPSPAQAATLKELILDNVSTVSDSGGLLFLDGIVTAVFPPAVISSDTVFWNQTPTAYCVTNPDQPGSHCPVEPTGDFIVNAGEAREFFPDGTNFNGYVRLIFHYCDNDSDGNIDTGTEGTYDGFTFNTSDGRCYVAGNPTATGTIDVNTLAVYNWDDSATAWVKLEGTVDRTNKTITVYSTHFSRYDTFGFRTGAAPQAFTPLQLTNIHTYPNPWRTTEGTPLRFAADTAAGDGSIMVEVKIFDIRGTLVASINNVVSKSGASYTTNNNAVTLAKWNATNRAGRPLASGVYLFNLQAKDLTNGTVVTQTGKLSIIH